MTIVPFDEPLLVDVPERSVLYVRVGLRRDPSVPIVPYLIDDVCRAAEDLHEYLERAALVSRSAPWCRFPRSEDEDNYLVVEHGVDVDHRVDSPDDWTIRLIREPAHQALTVHMIGDLADLHASAESAARQVAPKMTVVPGTWRWAWERIDPDGRAHEVTLTGPLVTRFLSDGAHPMFDPPLSDPHRA